eukprot:EG_transcript_443
MLLLSVRRGAPWLLPARAGRWAALRWASGDGAAGPRDPAALAEAVHGHQQRQDWPAVLAALERRDPGCVPHPETWNAGLVACLHLADHATAVRLMQAMADAGVQPDEEAYQLVITTCCNARQTELAVDALRRMVRAQIPATAATYTALIASCAERQYWDMADELFRRMLQDGIPIDTQGCNALLSAYTAAGRWQQGQQLLQWMADAGVRPDIVSYNTVLAALCTAEQLDRAFELFSSMSQAGLRPDTRTGSTLIAACATAGDVAAAFQVFDWMAQNDVHINTVVCNSVLSACASKSDWQSAFQVFDWMLEAGVPPDAVTCLGLIRSCRGTEQWQRAELVWKWALQTGLPVSDAMAAQLLRVHAAAGQADRATALADSLGALGLRRTVWTYAALAEARLRAGDPEGLWGALSAMLEAGVPPNAEVSMSLLTVALHQRRPGRLVYDLWKWLEAHGVPCDTACYNVVLTGCRTSFQALRVLAELDGRGLPRDALTYKALALLLAREGKWDELQQTLERCLADGLVPTEETFHLLLKHAAARRCAVAVRDAAAVFRRAGLPSTTAAYAALVRAAARCGDRVLALQAYRELRAAGLPVDLKSYTSIAQVVVEDYGLVREVLQAVEDAGLAFDSHAIAVLLKSCAHAGQWQSAEAVVAALPEADITPVMARCLSLAYARGGRWADALSSAGRRLAAADQPRFAERLLACCEAEADAEALWAWVASLPSVPLRLLRRGAGTFLRRLWWGPAGAACVALHHAHPAAAAALLAAELPLNCRTADDWAAAFQLLRHLQQTTTLDVAEVSPALLLRAARVLPPAAVEAWAAWQQGLGVEVDGRVYAAAQARLTDPTPSAPPDAAVVPEAVERWLRRLDGQQAGVAAYTAVIDQALRRKDYATPWEVLQHLCRGHLVPDSRCYHPVLFACLQTRDWPRVRTLVEAMLSAGLPLERWVAPRIARSGGWRFALFLLRLHRQHGRLPSGGTPQWVAAVCLAAGKPKLCLAAMRGRPARSLRDWRRVVGWACREAEGPAVLRVIREFLARPAPPMGLAAEEASNRRQLAIAARLTATALGLPEFAPPLPAAEGPAELADVAVAATPEEEDVARRCQRHIQDGQWDVALQALTAAPSPSALDAVLRQAMQAQHWAAVAAVAGLAAQQSEPTEDPPLWRRVFAWATAAQQWPQAFLAFRQVRRTGQLPESSTSLSFLTQCARQSPGWIAVHWQEVDWLVQRLLDASVELPAEVQQAAAGNLVTVDLADPVPTAVPAPPPAEPCPLLPPPLPWADATGLAKASAWAAAGGWSPPLTASRALGLVALGSVLAPHRAGSDALEAAWAAFCQQVGQRSSDGADQQRTTKAIAIDQLRHHYGPLEAFDGPARPAAPPLLAAHLEPCVTLPAVSAAAAPGPLAHADEWIRAVHAECSRGAWPTVLLARPPTGLTASLLDAFWAPLLELCSLPLDHHERGRRLQDLRRCGPPERLTVQAGAQLARLR